MAEAIETAISRLEKKDTIEPTVPPTNTPVPTKPGDQKPSDTDKGQNGDSQKNNVNSANTGDPVSVMGLFSAAIAAGGVGTALLGLKRRKNRK